jgi:hypothetical protein
MLVGGEIKAYSIFQLVGKYVQNKKKRKESFLFTKRINITSHC